MNCRACRASRSSIHRTSCRRGKACSRRSERRSPSIDRLRAAATNELIAEQAFDTTLRATLSGKSYRSTPEAFAAQIKSENEKYGALIRTLGIKIQ